MKENIIELKGVSKDYKETRAVNKLDLTISKGEIFGLLGPNGAGKSTTIYMILGLTKPTEGKITVCGLEPMKNQILVKKKVGFLPDDVGFYENMSGLENLVYVGKLNGLSTSNAKERALHLIKQVGLEEAMHKKAGKYSRGMRQRLGLADTLMKEPEVVIMDEPTLGIDPKGINEFLDMIQTLSKEHGITILLSSHQLHQVQKICDRVGIFVRGNLLQEGDIPTLQRALQEENHVKYKVVVDGSLAEFPRKMEEYSNMEMMERDSDSFILTLTKEDDGSLADFITSSGYKLLALEQLTYGLDDIYERYFQGGESIGTA
ncbi:ABC transporter ATP-binding protein [Salirhabdus sp. Marseille-P4669]|uniref:ABC transporter ATP-binding protein n=1 Tax=Salirhabdus sp. Marseille-P4669 TaxID=2042310 RepID=UPI000C796708|nr:ABC transporter ATP-binding protein [Salirhabdus sp. Marseille-P4669]